MITNKKTTFSVRDVATLCGVTGEAVRQWCRNGNLKSTWNGYCYSIERGDLLEHFLRFPKHRDKLLLSNPRGIMQTAIKSDILRDLHKMEKD